MKMSQHITPVSVGELLEVIPMGVIKSPISTGHSSSLPFYCEWPAHISDGQASLCLAKMPC